MILRDRLVSLRHQFGFSVREVIEESRIGKQRYMNIEDGNEPTFKEIKNLSKVYEISLSELFYDVE